MKYVSFLLAWMLLLSGCTSGQDINTESTSQTTSPTTAVTELPATEAPDPLETLLAGMALEEKVGQLFLARCPDVNAAADISTYHLGGYVLFARDLEGQTPDTLRQTLSEYQDAAAIPLLIAVDEEGGIVCRVSSSPAFRNTKFPSSRSLYDQGGLELALSMEAEKAALLSSLDINVNLAPVCDITTDPGSFMYSRSLGQSPEITGQFVERTVATMAAYGVGSVLKHFPGYGNNSDTHTGIAVDSRSLESLEAADLVPFRSGIAAGCGAIMISHTIVEAYDEILPASLSPAVHAYLRDSMGFDGIIMTDDLVMQAITDIYGAGEAAVLAVLAGNDILCCTEYQVQYSAVLEAVQNGRIPVELLDSAVMRILRWKQELGLIG